MNLTACPAEVLTQAGLARRSFRGGGAAAGHSDVDWISICPVAETNNTLYGENYYIGSGTSGTMTFTAPSSPADYEFRYLLDGGFTDAARSATVTVF